MLLWQKWVYGLAAAVIGGGAASVTAAFSATVIDPASFNIHAGLGHILELMGVCFLINGLMHAAGYLAQSPLPAVVSIDTTTVTVTKEHDKG
jgi:hypothetical protein